MPDTQLWLRWACAAVLPVCVATRVPVCRGEQTHTAVSANDTTPNTGLALDPTRSRESKTLAGSDLRASTSPPAVSSKRVERGSSGLFRRAETDGVVPWYRSGVVSLALVLSAILLVAALFKRFTRTSRTMGSDSLRVLCRHSLSSKQSLALVQMGRQLVFVGMTPDRITALRTVEDHDEIAGLLGKLSRSPKKGSQDEFEDLLNEQSGRLSVDIEAASVMPPGSRQEIRSARNELKGLISRLRSYQR